MVARLSRWWLVFALPLLLLGAVGVPASAGQASLSDQGWRLAEQAGQQVVELHALVVNASQSPLEYEVQFILESASLPPRSSVTPPGKDNSDAVPPEWSPVRTVSVTGGPVAPGESAAVVATFPYALLQSAKQYRFRAELVDRSSGAVLARSSITHVTSPWAAAAAFSGLVAAMELTQGAGHAGNLASGAGSMIGQHSAQRVGDQWVEHGSGTINLRTSEGRMVLDYTYDASGASAATLVASATATGDSCGQVRDRFRW